MLPIANHFLLTILATTNSVFHPASWPNASQLDHDRLLSLLPLACISGLATACCRLLTSRYRCLRGTSTSSVSLTYSKGTPKGSWRRTRHAEDPTRFINHGFLDACGSAACSSCRQLIHVACIRLSVGCYRLASLAGREARGFWGETLVRVRLLQEKVWKLGTWIMGISLTHSRLVCPALRMIKLFALFYAYTYFTCSPRFKSHTSIC